MGDLPTIFAWLTCSTPCGINGISPMDEVHHFVIVYVLNALRHQWNLHLAMSVSSTCASRCSTPCGINGIFTPGAGRCGSRPPGAQRLAASMESSPAMLPRSGRSCWCSTPCGINGIFTMGFWCGMVAAACAQRLAASMESSRLDQRNHRLASWCSTPCGINGIFTRILERARGT